jgi:hypothetical protein
MQVPVEMTNNSFRGFQDLILERFAPMLREMIHLCVGVEYYKEN